MARPSGEILVASSRTSDAAVLRVNADGSPDPGFGRSVGTGTVALAELALVFGVVMTIVARRRPSTSRGVRPPDGERCTPHDRWQRFGANRARSADDDERMGFRLTNIDDRASLVVGDRAVDLEEASGGRLGPDANDALSDPSLLSSVAAEFRDSNAGRPLADVVLGPPVPRPAQVFGVGLNYRNHAAEGGMDIPDVPLVFTKFRSCIAAPDADIELRSDFCDYEGELVVVIGSGGRDLAVGDAWAHVAGLCVGQDVSDRAVQMAASPPQFSLGKSFDTFGPIGPMVVSPDEVHDPSSLHITTHVNGQLRQDGNTADLIFDIPTLVSYLSHITTLLPGDLVFSGTPGGVGVAQGLFLADGDVITTTIDGVGTITNRCRRLPDHPNADTIPAGWRPAWKASTTDD